MKSTCKDCKLTYMQKEMSTGGSQASQDHGSRETLIASSFPSTKSQQKRKL